VRTILLKKDQKGYRSLWEMLQSPVSYPYRSRILDDLETPDGFLKQLRVA
jgi:hypothetical protein